MLKGLFVSKAGMLIQQRRLDIAANNLANLNTIGFKKDRIFFQKLTEAIADPLKIDENRAPGNTQVDFGMGTLKKTGNPLDTAIVDEGFFVIQAEEGEYYTRNGNFQLSSDGTLVTQDGYSVVTDGGELQISGSSVSINEQGEVIVDGQSIGRLRIVDFDDPQLLGRVGSAYYEAGNAAIVDRPEAEVNLRPGFLETSNVNPIFEMTAMIDLNREYELGQKAIKSQDETLQKLINQAGRLG